MSCVWSDERTAVQAVGLINSMALKAQSSRSSRPSSSSASGTCVTSANSWETKIRNSRCDMMIGLTHNSSLLYFMFDKGGGRGVSPGYGRSDLLYTISSILYTISNKYTLFIEEILEVKLPTIWTDEKQSREEAERRERLEEIRLEEKE